MELPFIGVFLLLAFGCCWITSDAAPQQKASTCGYSVNIISFLKEHFKFVTIPKYDILTRMFCILPELHAEQTGGDQCSRRSAYENYQFSLIGSFYVSN